MTIDDIVLDRDRRGVSALRPHLSASFTLDAARLVLENPGTAIVVTGFYILDAQAAETDGPPGAVVIGNALNDLGYSVVHVTDRYATSLMSATAGDHAKVIEFPIVDDDASRDFAAGLLKEVGPSVIISIERCGLTSEGLYRNMRGRDLTAYNARIDHIFTDAHATVGIGDGGNEIGMGNLADHIPDVGTLVEQPCVTKTTELVIASVSNWGGYGLVAALSELSGRNLLPSIEEERRIMRQTVDLGAVDGMSAVQEYKVDGFTFDENSETLQALHDYLSGQGISA